MSKTVALIDGDIIAYQCAVMAEDDFDGEVVLDRNGAIDNATATVDDWTERAGCDKHLVCFSDPLGNNFRKLLGSYKENREGHSKPTLYWDVVDAMHQKLQTMYIPWLEGDDVIGIFLTSPKYTGRATAVSIDKDIKTLPGRIFNPHKDEHPYENSLEDADRFHLMQSITGDVVDGYKGIPGVGPTKAADILDNPHRLVMNRRVISKGKNKGNIETKWKKGGPCGLLTSIHDYCTKHQFSYDQWVTQGQMARILRRDEYNKETGEIKLWTPKGNGSWLLPSTDK